MKNDLNHIWGILNSHYLISYYDDWSFSADDVHYARPQGAGEIEQVHHYKQKRLNIPANLLLLINIWNTRHSHITYIHSPPVFI